MDVYYACLISKSFSYDFFLSILRYLLLHRVLSEYIISISNTFKNKHNVARSDIWILGKTQTY